MKQNFLNNIIKVVAITMIMTTGGVQSFASSCSYNGTEIIFINGVWNNDPPIEASKRIKSIFRKKSGNADDLDLGYAEDTEGNVEVDYVHNRSKWGYLKDLVESAEQIESLKTDSKKYKKMAAHVHDVELVYPSGKIIAPTEKQRKDISDKIASHVQSSILDFDIADSVILSDRIKRYLEEHKKVILVSHSQGNLFASESHRTLNEYYPDDRDLMPYYGNMRLASPYTDGKIPHKSQRNILAQQDEIINNVLVKNRTSVTHKLKPQPVGRELYVRSNQKLKLKQQRVRYGSGHGVVGIYLNGNVMARKITSNVGYYKSMSQFFAEHMISLAKDIPSNCEKYVPSTIMLDREDTSEVVGNKKAGEESVLLSIDSSNVFPVGGEEDESKEADLTRFTGYIWSTNYARDPIATIDPELIYVIPENFDGILDKVTIRVQGVFEDGSVTEVSEKIIDIIPYCSKTGKYDPSLDKCIYDPPVAIGPTCISSELLPTANVNAGDRYFRDCSIEATIDCKGDPNCDTEFNCKGKTNCDPTFKRTDKNIQFTWHDYDETGSFAWYGWDGVSHKRNFTQSTYDSTVYKGNEIELCRCQF